MKNIYSLLIISIIAIFLYHPVLNAGYVWDDNLLFVNKVKLVNEPLSWAILTEPVLADTTYFRPLVFFTIYIEFYLFGQNPFTSHLLNLLILIFNAYLVSHIAYELLVIKKSEKALILSLISGMIYVINPVLVEATAWISGRFDLLVTTFSLLAIYSFIKIKKNTWLNSLLISFLFLLALFSKELGIVLPILIFFMYMYLNISSTASYRNLFVNFLKENYRLVLCITFSLIFYFILRLQAMGDVYHQKMDFEYIKFSYLDHYLPIHSLFFYTKQFIVPFDQLTPLLPFDNLNDSIYKTISKGLILLGIFVGLIFGVVKRNKYIWLIFSALICVSLVVYIIPITIANNIAHNRFLTLPIAFISILVVILPYDKLKPLTNKFLVLCLLVWMSLAMIITKSIVPFWHSDFTLWKWNYTVQPNNQLARNSYLYGLYQTHQFTEVKNIIDTYRSQSAQGLEVSDQMLYINTLISLNDPEAVKYAEGIYETLPKFHLKYKDKSDYKFVLMNDAQIATFYGSYALSKAVFEFNFDEALRLNNIAYWYLNEDEKMGYFYNEVAYLYLAGQVENALELYDHVNQKKAYAKDHYYYNMISIIDMVCKNKKMGNTDFCESQKNDFIHVLSS